MPYFFLSVICIQCSTARAFAMPRFETINKATMHLDHKPGEQMEVDWAGDAAKVTDPETGSQTPAYLFIAVLSCSGYAYRSSLATA